MHKNKKTFANTLATEPFQQQVKYYERPIKRIRPIHVYKRLRKQHPQITELLSVTHLQKLKSMINDRYNSYNANDLHPLYHLKEWQDVTKGDEKKALKQYLYNKELNNAGYFKLQPTNNEVFNYINELTFNNHNPLKIQLPSEQIKSLIEKSQNRKKVIDSNLLTYIITQQQYSTNFTYANQLFQYAYDIHAHRLTLNHYLKQHHPIQHTLLKIASDYSSNAIALKNRLYLTTYYQIPYQLLNKEYYQQSKTNTHYATEIIKENIRHRLNKVRTTGNTNQHDFQKSRHLDILKNTAINEPNKRIVTSKNFENPLIRPIEHRHIIDRTYETVQAIKKALKPETKHELMTEFNITMQQDDSDYVINTINEFDIMSGQAENERLSYLGLTTPESRQMILTQKYNYDKLKNQLDDIIYDDDDIFDTPAIDAYNIENAYYNLIKTQQYVTTHKYSKVQTNIDIISKINPTQLIYHHTSSIAASARRHIHNPHKVKNTIRRTRHAQYIDQSIEKLIENNQFQHIIHSTMPSLLTAMLDMQPIYFDMNDGIFLKNDIFDNACGELNETNL